MKLGVSSCLLGDLCRYDGAGKRDEYILKTLSKYFEFQKFCPEHLAFGTPRDSMKLVETENGIKAINNKTDENLTKDLEAVSSNFVDSLKENELCGFILKSKSPSCGMERVKIYEENSHMNEKKGIGLFALALKNRLPYLPMEEEGRLEDAWLRENFIMQIFAYKDFFTFLDTKPSMKDLVTFHSSYKYLIYSKSMQLYKELGNIVANHERKKIEVLLEEYKELFLKTITLKSSIKKTYNILEHILGYFKKQISKEEKQNLLETMSEYKQKIIPLVTVIKLFNIYINKYDIEYLKIQKFLEPYPNELALRSDIKAYK